MLIGRDDNCLAYTYKSSPKSKTRIRRTKFAVEVYNEFEQAICESNMIAGNIAEMMIYRLTGIMYSGNIGSMYYFIGKGQQTKRIYIRKVEDKWINPSVKIEGGYLYIKQGKKKSELFLKNKL